MRWVLVGVVTWYAGVYVGGPLYCGGTYEVGGEPWVALDAGLEGMVWERGDLVYLSGPGWSLMARVRDTGPLGRYGVEVRPGEVVPIVADVPGFAAPWEGLSSRGEVWNVTAMARAAEAGTFWQEYDRIGRQERSWAGQ